MWLYIFTYLYFFTFLGDGEQTIICNAKDGKKSKTQDVECGLWIGTQPFIDAKDFDCRNADRDDVCVEFEADLYKDEHDGLELYVLILCTGCPTWIATKVNMCCDYYVFWVRHFSLQIYARNMCTFWFL